MENKPPSRDQIASPKAIVRAGWNRVSRIYRPDDSVEDRFGHTNADYREWLRSLIERIPRGAGVLDLGCGCGVPTGQVLAERFKFTGVDISDVQIDRARVIVPKGTFIRADMTEVTFPPETFAAVVSLYALIHVPLEEQRDLLGKIHEWLTLNGVFLAILGDKAWTGTEENWLGSDAKMYWSHADGETYHQWLRESGFEVLRRSFVPEDDEGHALFLARKQSIRVPSPLR